MLLGAGTPAQVYLPCRRLTIKHLTHALPSSVNLHHVVKSRLQIAAYTEDQLAG